MPGDWLEVSKDAMEQHILKMGIGDSPKLGGVWFYFEPVWPGETKGAIAKEDNGKFYVWRES